MSNLFELLRTGDEGKFLARLAPQNMNQTDELGQSLLHVAIARGKRKAAAELISRKANLDHQDNDHGYAPLHVAAEYTDAQTTELLINAGADVNLLDKHGNSPLWTAVFRSQSQDRGLDVVRMILKAGADPNHKNKAGRSPRDIARQFEDDKLIRVLSTKKNSGSRKTKGR